MPHATDLATHIRNFLSRSPELQVEEKMMFGGLTFMVNGKMCLSVKGEQLMCRFDPDLHEEMSTRKGFQSLSRKGGHYKGHAYIQPEGYETAADLEHWLQLCVDYNPKAPAPAPKRKAKG